uniref:Uncharacterized protein LOC104216349 n=1 Tax=Nicotiana sylvestris TaxID=4096 RepID=A0A1U7VE76_NICSY
DRGSHIWWQAYELSRPVSIVTLSWHDFLVLFLEKFVPQNHREELARDFERLRQGDMTVTYYKMRFKKLDLQVIWLFPTKMEKIKRFIDGLNYSLSFSMARVAEMVARFDQISTSSSLGYQGQQSFSRGFCVCGDLRRFKRDSLDYCVGFHNSSQPNILAPAATPPELPARGRAQSARGLPRGRSRSGGLPRIEWRGSLEYVPNRVISYLKAQRMVGKGYMAYLSSVKDISTDASTIKSISALRDFIDVFPVDLPCMAPNRDKYYGIDLVQGIQSISIPPCRMTPLELKELKEQILELHDKSFIRPSDTVQRDGAKEDVIDDDGVMELQGRICVTNIDELRYFILEEAHN